jgi:hypothetical protein
MSGPFDARSNSSWPTITSGGRTSPWTRTRPSLGRRTCRPAGRSFKSRMSTGSITITNVARRDHRARRCRLRRRRRFCRGAPLASTVMRLRVSQFPRWLSETLDNASAAAQRRRTKFSVGTPVAVAQRRLGGHWTWNRARNSGEGACHAPRRVGPAVATMVRWDCSEPGRNNQRGKAQEVARWVRSSLPDRRRSGGYASPRSPSARRCGQWVHSLRMLTNASIGLVPDRDVPINE